MGVKNISVHPLFFLFGLYYSLTGRIVIFILYTLTALLHELGHSFTAMKKGYMLNKICLMPFGAVVSGDMSGMSAKDELSIAFAGPLINIFVSLFFIAFWWIAPPIYAVTDIIVSANLSLAIINFLPFFPLDGGRILLCLLALKMNREKALKICRMIGVFGGLILFCLFVVTCFYSVNISLLFFSCFIIVGAIYKSGGNKYLRLCTQISSKRLSRGIVYKKIAIDKNVSIKKLLLILDGEYLNEVVVYSNGAPYKTISPEKLEKILTNGQLDSPIAYYVN